MVQDTKEHKDKTTLNHITVNARVPQVPVMLCDFSSVAIIPFKRTKLTVASAAADSRNKKATLETRLMTKQLNALFTTIRAARSWTAVRRVAKTYVICIQVEVVLYARSERRRADERSVSFPSSPVAFSTLKYEPACGDRQSIVVSLLSVSQ